MAKKGQPQPAEKSQRKARAKTPARTAASGGDGRPAKPFGSIDEFLFEVLTLRGNAAYRKDFEQVAKFDDLPPLENDWARIPMDESPLPAARSLIGTWNLICTMVKRHYDQDADRTFFFENSPVANMYARLKPAIDRIKGEMTDPEARDRYAAAFEELGEAALAKVPSLAEFATPAKQRGWTASQQRERYRSAEASTRAMTHFG